MFVNLFRLAVDRIRALLVGAAAQSLEADLLAHHADLKADLLRRAAEYEADGLGTVADDLRSRAGALTPDKPTASILPAVSHLMETAPHEALPAPQSSVLALPAPTASTDGPRPSDVPVPDASDEKAAAVAVNRNGHGKGRKGRRG